MPDPEFSATDAFGRAYRYVPNTSVIVVADPVRVHLYVERDEHVVRMDVGGIEIVLTPDLARRLAASLDRHAAVADAQARGLEANDAIAETVETSDALVEGQAVEAV
jgi:hypothetical protein